MDHEFWHQRWHDNQIGFHRPDVHPMLMRHFDALGAKRGERVFVPLCGKSLDMLWLREQGSTVIGVEISPVAARAFFEENGISYVARQEGDFRVLTANALQIYCGDYFALPAEVLAGCHAVYDRAALIAMPRDQRTRYTHKLMQLVEPDCRILLITLEYPQAQMDGPPFSVGMDEVRSHFGQRFAITELESVDALAESRQLAQRGLSELTERAILLS